MISSNKASNIISSNVLPLDFDIDYKSNTDNTIENGIGKGFMQEDKYKCEYYWNNIKGGLYRRIIDCNSYACAAYSETPVVKPFMNPIEFKMDLVTKKYKKYILKYNPVPDNIYTLYDKNINADYNLNKKKQNKVIVKRKHRQNKKNKPDKHYKLLNEQFPNWDSDEDEDCRGWDNYDDCDENFYDDYWQIYYMTCRGPYNDTFSRCFGLCCN